MAEQRLFQTIAEQLRQIIDDGDFPPGSRLPGERELAERFDVSRVTIREAEIALQAVGVIDIRTGAGVYVCEDQPDEPGALPDVSAFELTEARSLIEGEAAALAAKMISPETMAKLESLMDDMASEDESISTPADRDFHATIASASGNRVMLHTIQQLWRMREEVPGVQRSYASICYSHGDARAREHQEIFDALAARDPDRARAAMRQHFHRLIATLLDLSEQEALDEVRQRASDSRARFLSPAP